jgi:hypothetical protein
VLAPKSGRLPETVQTSKISGALATRRAIANRYGAIMTITLPSDIERVAVETARQQGTTLEAVVLGALREKLTPSPSKAAKALEPRDEWEWGIRSVGTPCGVAVSDEALSSEGLYD